VLSGRGLCDELITRPEESYRLCCVVCDLETSRMGAPYIYDISRLRVNVHGSVHRESMQVIVQQDATMYSLLYFCKLLYCVLRMATPPIIRNTYNCNYHPKHVEQFTEI